MAKATYWGFEVFAMDLHILGIKTLDVRRPGTTTVRKGALYSIVVPDAATADEVEKLAASYNKLNPANVTIQSARQRSCDNSTNIIVLVWGFKPIYAHRSPVQPLASDLHYCGRCDRHHRRTTDCKDTGWMGRPCIGCGSPVYDGSQDCGCGSTHHNKHT